jgi:hypothetical protein
MRCSRSMNVPRDCFSNIPAVDALLRRFRPKEARRSHHLRAVCRQLAPGCEVVDSSERTARQ